MTYDEDYDWIEVEVTVENKTDKTLFFYFDYDVRVDGLDETAAYTIILVSNDIAADYDFPPKKTTTGIILFLEAPKSKKIENFRGTIVVCDTEEYDTLGEYKFKITSIK